MTDVPTSIADIRADIDTAWSDWITALDNVPPETIGDSGACGTWSVKDLIGHVAVWNWKTVFRMRKLRFGTDLEEPPYQEVNELEWKRRKDWTLDSQRADMNASHQSMLDAFGWFQNPDTQTLERISQVSAKNDSDHYREHTAQVVDWIAQLPGS